MESIVEIQKKENSNYNLLSEKEFPQTRNKNYNQLAQVIPK